MPFFGAVRRGASAVIEAIAGYEVGNSIRLNDNDSAHMTWTPSGSPDGTRKLAISFWLKLGNIAKGVSQLISQDWTASGSNALTLSINWLGGSDAAINLTMENNAGAAQVQRATTQLFRDPTSWFHLYYVIDTGQTDDTACSMYINGTQVTAFGTKTNPSSAFDHGFLNNGKAINLYRFQSGTNYYDGYASQVYIQDTPTSAAVGDAGEVDSEGEWRPVDVTGLTPGTNGFLQTYEVTPGTGNGAGTDSWGSNHFTDSGLAANDQVSCSPTNVFATMSPIHNLRTSTLSDGNLLLTGADGWDTNYATQVIQGGKWYFEALEDGTDVSGPMVGVQTLSSDDKVDAHIGSGTDGWAIYFEPASGVSKYTNNTNTTLSLGTAASGGKAMIAVDADNGKIWFGYDGTWSGDPAAGTGEAYSGLPSDLKIGGGTSGPGPACRFGFGAATLSSGGNADDNGYGDFEYAPPSGFLALCTANLTALDFDPAEHHQVETGVHDIAGDGAFSFTANFDLDDYDWMMRIKNRDSAENWFWVNSIDGEDYHYRTSVVGDTLQNVTTLVTTSGTTVTLGSSCNDGDTYLVELFRAGLVSARDTTNSDGSLTGASDSLIISANTTAGFSILNYTGTGSNETIGHGLPTVDMIYCFNDAAETAICGHRGAGWEGNLRLDATSVQSNDPLTFQDHDPADEIYITVGTNVSINKSSTTTTMFCFQGIAGYSAFGSYEGNASADGVVINGGIKPTSLFLKNIDSAVNWSSEYTAIETYNPVDLQLRYNLTGAEAAVATADILSNGRKARDTGTPHNSAHTFVYGIWGTPTVNKSGTPAKAR